MNGEQTRVPRAPPENIFGLFLSPAREWWDIGEMPSTKTTTKKALTKKPMNVAKAAAGIAKPRPTRPEIRDRKEKAIAAGSANAAIPAGKALGAARTGSGKSSAMGLKKRGA
jgi:hypothetical protein